MTTKPHKHAELIKAWADGATIQYRMYDGDWEDVPLNKPNWYSDHEYRIKPEPPKYPQTSLTADDMAEIARNAPGIRRDAYIAIANAAIARAIDDRQVIVPGPWLEQTAEGFIHFGKEYVPAAMLEKVAMRVQRRCIEEAEYFTNGVQIGRNISRVDLAAIIASVKEGEA